MEPADHADGIPIAILGFVPLGIYRSELREIPRASQLGHEFDANFAPAERVSKDIQNDLL